MKRIIALFLVCILAVPILAVPAYAAETDYEIDYSGQFVEIYNYFEKVVSKLTSINLNIGYLLEDFNAWRDDFRTYVGTTLYQYFQTLWQNIELYIVSHIVPELQHIKTAITDFKDEFLGHTQWLATFTNDVLPTYFSGLADKISGYITEQTTAISGFFTNLTSNLSGWFNQLINGPDHAEDTSDALGSMFEEQLGQYEENEQIIATAPTINPDDYDVIFDFGAEIPDGFTSDYTGILSRMLEIEYIGYLIVTPIIFGFVGYVLHGKVF